MQKILNKNEIALVIFEGGDYNKSMITLTKQLSKKFNRIGYVSLNKGYVQLIQGMEKNGIDKKKFFFVDAVSTAAEAVSIKEKQVSFVFSAENLTQMSLIMCNALLKYKLDCIIFDSLSTLLIYHEEDMVLKFLHYIINNLRNRNVTAIFTAVKNEKRAAFIENSKIFVDRTINLGK